MAKASAGMPCGSVLFLATLLTVAASSWIDGNDGVDRPGGDLADMPIFLKSTQLASVCAQLCQNNSQCVAWSYSKADCKETPYCNLKSKVSQQTYDPCKVCSYFYNIRSSVWHTMPQVSGVKNAQLEPPAFRPLPVGAVQPAGLHTSSYSYVYKCVRRYECRACTGWLKEQLAIQADGLSGHLPFFWQDVMNSSWIGGSADTGLHERTPYWLNGFIPLAYQLQDPTLIQTVSS